MTYRIKAAEAAFKRFFDEQDKNVEWEWDGERGRVLVDAVFQLDDLIATILAATDPVPEAPAAWQPMDTAPKDEPILAYRPGYIDEYAVVRWADGWWSEPGKQDCPGWYLAARHLRPVPEPLPGFTHWTSLPFPPGAPNAR